MKLAKLAKLTKQKNDSTHIEIMPSAVTASQKFWQAGVEVLLSVALLISGWICWLLMFDVPYNTVVLVSLLVGFPALFQLLSQKLSMRQLAVYAVFVIAVVSAVFYQQIGGGCLEAINRIFMVLNQMKGFSYVLYESGVPAGEEAAAIIKAMIPLAALTSLSVFAGVKRRRFLLAFLATAPFLLSGIIFLISPDIYPLLILIVAWVVLGVYCAAGGRRAKTLVYPRSTQKPILITAAAVMAAVLVFYGVMQIALPAKEYERTNGIEGARQELIAFADQLRYESGIQIEKLPAGDFSQVRNLTHTGIPALLITMERPRPVYLRGFVGSVYKNDGWAEELPSEATAGDYDGIFEWLYYHKFYPQTQLADLVLLAEATPHGRVAIENLALNSKYIYAPYEAVATRDLLFGSVRFNKDSNILSKGLLGSRKYTFDMYLPEINDYGIADLTELLTEEILGSEGYQDYAEAEKLYRTFVYNTYLGVPSEIAEMSSPEDFEGLKDRDYKLVTAAVRKYFEDNFSFSYELESGYEDTDLVNAFLSSKVGYDIHFTTLAVFLFRQAGVPARYVEGYYLPFWETNMYSRMTNIIFELSDYYAHAWVEVYADGFGWLPIEVTPGFYSMTDSQEQFDELSEQQKDNPIYFYPEDKDVSIHYEAPPPPPEPEKLFNYWFVIIPLAAVLVLLYLLLRKRCLKKRRQSFAQQDSRLSALAMYGYAARLLKFCGDGIDPRASYALLAQVGERYDISDTVTLKGFLDIVYKARFSVSEETLNQQELAYLQVYTENIALSAYNRQALPRRLWMRFVWLI